MTPLVRHYRGAVTGGFSGRKGGKCGAFDIAEEAPRVPPVSEAAKKDGDGVMQVAWTG